MNDRPGWALPIVQSNDIARAENVLLRAMLAKYKAELAKEREEAAAAKAALEDMLADGAFDAPPVTLHLHIAGDLVIEAA